jgi:hypothetical protein
MLSDEFSSKFTCIIMTYSNAENDKTAYDLLVGEWSVMRALGDHSKMNPKLTREITLTATRPDCIIA